MDLLDKQTPAKERSTTNSIAAGNRANPTTGQSTRAKSSLLSWEIRENEPNLNVSWDSRQALTFRSRKIMLTSKKQYELKLENLRTKDQKKPNTLNIDTASYFHSMHKESKGNIMFK